MKILITGGSGFIGTNLIDLLGKDQDFSLINIDNKRPLKSEHECYWKNIDIMQTDEVEAIIRNFRPDQCVHLAAETEIKSGASLEVTYPVNTIGSKRFLELLRKCKVQRTIVISTQYVCGPSEKLPVKNDDYWPHTEYGKSKVILEQNTREILPQGTFVIARPTYIWGTWNYKNFSELVRTIAHRHYIHPQGKPVIRSYGYVGNVCAQIQALLTMKPVSRDWFYLGEQPIDSFEFVNKLSLALTGKSVRSLPKWILFPMAKFGDMINPVVKFPFNSFRYGNMTMDYRTPMDATIGALGQPPFSLDDAVAEFCAWHKRANKKE